MESSINSSCCSESPTVSEEGSRPETRRIEEENRERKIMEADLVDTGKGKPQLPPFNTRSLRKIKECNANTFRHPRERSETVDKVMEALADPNTHIMGFHCSNENAMKVAATLFERVTRRAHRDNMFDVILKATATKKRDIIKNMFNVILKAVGTKKSNNKKIQDEIAAGLNLPLDRKSTVERATILHNKIKTKPKILIILDELYEGIDLKKVGIPYGADHSGCKILLTSTSEDVLSNQMHTQKNFLV